MQGLTSMALTKERRVFYFMHLMPDGIFEPLYFFIKLFDYLVKFANGFFPFLVL